MHPLPYLLEAEWHDQSAQRYDQEQSQQRFACSCFLLMVLPQMGSTCNWIDTVNILQRPFLISAASSPRLLATLI